MKTALSIILSLGLLAVTATAQQHKGKRPPVEPEVTLETHQGPFTANPAWKQAQARIVPNYRMLTQYRADRDNLIHAIDLKKAAKKPYDAETGRLNTTKAKITEYERRVRLDQRVQWDIEAQYITSKAGTH